MSPANPAADSFNEIATLRIELKDSDPLIWRQVDVPTSITLKTLHNIIQVAIGWCDCHLWEFTIAKHRYGLPVDEDWGTEPRIDASKVRLRDVLSPRKTTIERFYQVSSFFGLTLRRHFLWAHPSRGAGFRLLKWCPLEHRGEEAAQP